GLTLELVAFHPVSRGIAVIRTRCCDPSSLSFQRSRGGKNGYSLSHDDSTQMCSWSGKIPSHSLCTNGSSMYVRNAPSSSRQPLTTQRAEKLFLLPEYSAKITSLSSCRKSCGSGRSPRTR